MRNSDLNCSSEYKIIRFIENILKFIKNFRMILRKLINIIPNILIIVIIITRVPSKDI